MATEIIDVSQFNTITSWAAVAASGTVKGAIIRAGYRGYGTKGTLVTDSKFHTNMSAAIAAGLPVGVYFVTQAVTEAEAIAEADYVVSLCKSYKLTYPIYWDSENGNNGKGRADHGMLSKATRTACAAAFCKRIKQLGYTPGVYASQSWFQDDLDCNSLTGYSLWVAKYSSIAPTLAKYDAWQYTDSGSVAGITGKVDMSHWYQSYGTESEGSTLTEKTWKSGIIAEIPLKQIEHIECAPMSGSKGESLTSAAKRIQWNGRYPDVICNAELFNMTTYQPASAVVHNGVAALLTETYGFAFKNSRTPVFSYKNNVNAPEYIGASPVLVRDGKKAFTTTPAGLTGKRARTALALNSEKLAVIGVPATTGCTLDELAEECISLGYTHAINLDGGGSTAYATKNIKYDQGRAIRGFIAIWYSGGTGNKVSLGASGTSSSAAPGSVTMLQNAKYKSGVARYVNVKSTSYLNVRRYASTSSASVKKLKRGTAVSWYGYYTSDNKWLYVKCADGTCGYASAAYLSETKPT